MKKSLIFILVGLATFCISVDAKETPVANITETRFVACENNAGAGFFWLDSTCGKVWRASPADCKWVYYGRPDGAKEGKAGRYIPCKNKSGGGLFVLDCVSGEGWWTNGQEWKKMGAPKD